MLHLRTFGALELLRADGSHINLQRRPFALIAIVAAGGLRGASRQKALGLLWPDVDDDRARHALAQTLYALRRSCGADVIDGTATLRLDSEIVSCDVIDFGNAVAAGDSAAAAALYSGSFLDGFHLPNASDFERWVEGERARLQRAAARVLESCASAASATGNLPDAPEWWRRVAALDPLDARVALALARALAAADDASGALRQAENYQNLRRTELELPPDAGIVAFIRELRASCATTPSKRQLAVIDSSQQDSSWADGSHGPVAVNLADATLRSRSRRRRWSVVVAIVVAIAVVVSLAAYRTRPLNQHRVVVAVFDNRTADTSLAPLGDVTADWVATELARTGLVDVIDSRAVISSASERDTSSSASASSMRDLARDVGAGIMVWGTYYRRGDSLEFHAEVTDVRDGALLREIPPIVASVQNPMKGVQQLSERVMGALATIENPRLSEWATRGGMPPSYDAYREFVDGVEAQVRMDPVSALAHYKRARSLDSTFLQPLLFGADAEHTLGRAALAEAELDTVAADRDRLIPADRDLLDYQLAVFHGQPERAYQVARDMARLSPSSESFLIAGQGALYVARPAEALQWYKRVDPTKGWVSGYAAYWMQAVISAHMAGDDQEALRLAAAARLAFPDQVIGYTCLVAPLAALGRVDQLRAEMDSAANAPGHEWWSYGETLDLAGAELAIHGDTSAAHEMWERAVGWYAARSRSSALTPDMSDLQVRVLLRAGHAALAESRARALVRANSDNGTYLGTLGVAEAGAGDSADARTVGAELAKLAHAAADSDAIIRGSIALAQARVAAATLDSTDAVSFLREALRDEAITVYQLHRHPVYRSIASYPPFQELSRPRG